MRVGRLGLEDFRSYAEVDLALARGTTAFVGANGAGKTNLLEAIHLAARGESPRDTRIPARRRAAQRTASRRSRRARDPRGRDGVLGSRTRASRVEHLAATGACGGRARRAIP